MEKRIFRLRRRFGVLYTGPPPTEISKISRSVFGGHQERDFARPRRNQFFSRPPRGKFFKMHFTVSRDQCIHAGRSFFPPYQKVFFSASAEQQQTAAATARPVAARWKWPRWWCSWALSTVEQQQQQKSAAAAAAAARQGKRDKYT